MDSSFTEHVLERARERQRKLGPLREANVSSNSQPNLSSPKQERIARKEVVSDPVPKCSPTISRSKTKISSTTPGSPHAEFGTLNIQRDSFNMEIKFSSTDNVRLEVEIDSEPDENQSPGNNRVVQAPVLSEHGKSRLQQLGKLYSDEDLSSPIHRTEGKFQINDDREVPKDDSDHQNENGRVRGKGLGRLADLAKNINQWEDDIAPPKKMTEVKKTQLKKSWKPPAPQPPAAQVISPKKPNKGVAPKPPTTQTSQASSSPTKQTSQAPSSPTKQSFQAPSSPTKQIKWDQAVLDNLESQGFTRTQSSSRLVYNYDKPSQEKKPRNPEKIVEETGITAKTFVPLNAQKEEQKLTPRTPTKTNVSSRAALFEQKAASPSKKEKDPALLSISERKALFEKNPGEALVPRAAFGMAAPIKASTSTDFKAANKGNFVGEVPQKEPGGIAGKIAQLIGKKTISQEQIENKAQEERKKDMEILLNRFNRNKVVASSNDSESDDDNELEMSETTAMISTKPAVIVKPRLSSDLPPPPPPPVDGRKSGEKRPKKGDSPQVQAVLEDVKRIKVAHPKEGQLYPCLSDIEANTETENDRTASPTPNNSLLEDSFCESDDGANTSFGREILQAVCNNKKNQKIMHESSESDLSEMLEGMNDYEDELDDEIESIGPTPAKHSKFSSSQIHASTQPSQSFNYKNCSPKKGYSPKKKYPSPRKLEYSPQKMDSPKIVDTIEKENENQSPPTFKSPCKIITSPRKNSDGPTHVVEGSDILPLTYTVSFYRKQQTQNNHTPVRQIVRQASLINEEESNLRETNDEVEAKVESLKEEVQKLQMVISQTSRALNLCNATPEFTGSSEQVEAERVLLLTTHRRQAANMEIQRLNVEHTLRPLNSHMQNIPVEKGTLSISGITLPLKKEYVRALAAAGGKGHHVVCLIKCADQVVSTQIASTVASSSKNPDMNLKIPGQVKLMNIHSDFTVTFEVYCLQAQEEILPHEVKYHINSKKSNNKSTPKNSKKDSRMVRPPKESPAGPQAVRTSTFALNGYVVFSIQAINKTNWTLNKTPPISPLEGSVLMKVNCELDISVEFRGFLNMFEDVSGLGAWHRRWCLLKGHLISYWKYPEDERKKAPIDTINLKTCITKNVGPVTRDICARQNTFLFERERSAEVHDKDTLTVTCKGDKTVIRHLLSADTKEERVEWCININKALMAVRMWGKTSTDIQ